MRKKAFLGKSKNQMMNTDGMLGTIKFIVAKDEPWKIGEIVLLSQNLYTFNKNWIFKKLELVKFHAKSIIISRKCSNWWNLGNNAQIRKI